MSKKTILIEITAKSWAQQGMDSLDFLDCVKEIGERIDELLKEKKN